MAGVCKQFELIFMFYRLYIIIIMLIVTVIIITITILTTVIQNDKYIFWNNIAVHLKYVYLLLT